MKLVQSFAILYDFILWNSQNIWNILLTEILPPALANIDALANKGITISIDLIAKQIWTPDIFVQYFIPPSAVDLFLQKILLFEIKWKYTNGIE